MAHLFLIRGAKQLLTLRGPPGLRRGLALEDLSVIEDGSILIRDGVIAQIGSTRRIENLKECRGASEIAVNGAIVMPGFVDPGIHLSPAAPAAGAKRKGSREFYDQTLSLLRSCLQHGTLNAQIKVSARNHELRANISLLRELLLIGNHPVAMIRTWRLDEPAIDSPEDTADLPGALPALMRRKLLQRVEAGPAADGDFCEKVWTAAAGSGLAVNLLWRGGSAEVLSDLLQRVQPRSVTCPCTLSPTECAVLGQSAVPVIFSPAESMMSASFNDRVSRTVKNGAPIALSSGYDDVEMPIFNMQTAISLAVLRLGLTAEQAISAATINAAYAAGVGHAVGTLEVGKRADVLVMNLSDYREIPRRFGVNHVGMAIREGRILFNRTGWKVSAA